MINTFVMMGLPGAGKGKQANLLASKMGFAICSSGPELRNVFREGSSVDKKLEALMNSGGVAPSWIASYVFQDALFKLLPEEGIVFDGLGRRETEARLFEEICNWLGREYVVFNLNLSEESALERLNSRRDLEDRKDDEPEVFHNRFKNFQENTQPSIDYFRSIGKLIEIDSEPLPEVVFEEIQSKISNL